MAKCLINGTNNNGNTGRAIEVMNFFVGKGLSPTQACAIAGNCYVESGRAYDPKSLNKNDCNENKTKCGPSYGLFQWHDVCTRKNPDGSWDESSCTGRFKNLKVYCANNGLDYTTMKGQLEFLWHENAGGFKEYFQTNNKLSIDAYTKWWEQNWEACRTCDHNARVSEAKRLAGIYNQTNKTECAVDISGSSSSTGGGFSCNDGLSSSSESADSVSVGDDPTVANTANAVVDTKPLIIGDGVAYKILTENGSFKGKYAPIIYSKEPLDIPKYLAKYTSNSNLKPKYILACVCHGLYKTASGISSLNELDFSAGKRYASSFIDYIVNAAHGVPIYWAKGMYTRCGKNVTTELYVPDFWVNTFNSALDSANGITVIDPCNSINGGSETAKRKHLVNNYCNGKVMKTDGWVTLGTLINSELIKKNVRP